MTLHTHTELFIKIEFSIEVYIEMNANKLFTTNLQKHELQVVPKRCLMFGWNFITGKVERGLRNVKSEGR